MRSTMIDGGCGADEELLTAREAGEYARVAEKTLANWRSLGIGPPFKKLSPGRGGRVRYSKRGLIGWLNRDAESEAA